VGTLSSFNSIRCPRCELDYLFPVGDAQSVRLPLNELAIGVSRGIDCYVKACKNCGFIDFYSTVIVDSVASQTPAGETNFGKITKAGGNYLLSIYVPDGPGKTTDFTVPLSAERWFTLRTVIDNIKDDQLLSIVYPEPYQRAWKERVGEFPPAQLAMHVRQLITSFKDGP
jgi:hypothetical protein